MSKRLEVKIKKLDPNAVIPSYAKLGDACMDLTAISETIVEENGFAYIEYGTGLAFEVPQNNVMLLYPRSSISNTGLLLANAVGVVDAGDREEIRLRFKWIKGSNKYSVGDRVGQFMIIPRPIMELKEVEELSDTERGQGGWGSTN
ncbi:MAG: dUTP diphosphatase [Romboutsia sp.]|nr:dUTP diphosphatase [Romboutsia sp.]